MKKAKLLMLLYLVIVATSSQAQTSTPADFTLNDNELNQNIRMRIDPNGRIYVGSGLWNRTFFSDYRLYVEKGVRTEKVKVDLNNGWADFVFEPNYDLKPLNEVETFIKKHKHLPDVPSEKELKEKGMDLGEMHKVQMQKIEELTLYIIALKKQNLVLEDRLKALEQKLKE